MWSSCNKNVEQQTITKANTTIWPQKLKQTNVYVPLEDNNVEVSKGK